MDASSVALFREVRPFTLTSIERIFAVGESVKYIVGNNIKGSIVECGALR
jgi:hypothetical protein